MAMQNDGMVQEMTAAAGVGGVPLVTVMADDHDVPL
jgi:hypothetical protein